MDKRAYGSGTGKYGLTDCKYCDKKDIKREIIGNHLYKCHKDKLKENFGAYLNMPPTNQPLVAIHSKIYTFCFACNLCHNTTANNKPSMPAINHMKCKCSYEEQMAGLKSLFEDDKKDDKSPDDVITIPVVVTPTYKTHISNNPDNSIYEEKLSIIMAEMAKLKEEIAELRKSKNVIVQEIPEACGDCKEWGDAFSDKLNEVNELKEKLGI